MRLYAGKYAIYTQLIYDISDCIAHDVFHLIGQVTVMYMQFFYAMLHAWFTISRFWRSLFAAGTQLGHKLQGLVW